MSPESQRSVPVDDARESPISVYLDQSVYGYVLGTTGGEWSQSEMAKVSAGHSVEFWASPSNVVELYLCADLKERQALAALVLGAISALRMAHSFEFGVADDFLRILQTAAKAAVHRDMIRSRMASNCGLYLGALALAAAYPAKREDALVDHLVRIKTENQLMHLRFARSADAWLANMIASCEGDPIPQPDLLKGISTMTVPEMRSEIQEGQTSVKAPTRDVRKGLQKRRKALAWQYGMAEVPSSLIAALPHPIELQWTVYVPGILGNWDVFRTALGFGKLPPRFADAKVEDMLVIEKHLDLVSHICREMAQHGCGPLAAYLRFSALLWELQKSFGKKTVPTAGLTFDLNHIVGLLSHDVFVTRDGSLAATASTLANELGHHPEVVKDADQLARAIKRVQQRREA